MKTKLSCRKNAFFIVCIISVVLLVLLAVVIKRYNLAESIFKNDIDISFEIYSDNHKQKISLWENEKEGIYYCFLPSYANLNDIKIYAPKNLLIDGKPISKIGGVQRLSNIELNKKYIFSVKSKKYTVIFMKSANVATMCINTKSGFMYEVHKNKKNREPICMTLFNENGNVDYISNNYSDKIKGRGNTTWRMADKKPYNLYLNMSSELIDGHVGKEWALLANAFDKSQIRNRVIYDLANKTGNIWNPNTRYVDLYLNGDYAGLYLLSEKVEVAPNKLSLNKDDILFYLELNTPDRVSNNRTITDLFEKISAEIVYPVKISSDRFSFAEKYVRKIFKMLEDGKISENDLDKYIDVESFAWLYLIQEFSANKDAGIISIYFYLHDNKLFAGSVWDYDLTLGVYEEVAPDILYAKTKLFWKHIYKYQTFRQSVSEMYKEIFKPEFDIISPTSIKNLTEFISFSLKCDRTRWKYEGAEDVKNLCQFILKRIEFLDKVFIDGESFHTICVNTLTAYSETDRYISVNDETAWEDLYTDIGLADDVDFICYDTVTGKQIKPEGKICTDATIQINSVAETKDVLMIFIKLLQKAVIVLFVLCILFLIVIGRWKRHDRT